MVTSSSGRYRRIVPALDVPASMVRTEAVSSCIKARRESAGRGVGKQEISERKVHLARSRAGVRVIGCRRVMEGGEIFTSVHLASVLESVFSVRTKIALHHENLFFAVFFLFAKKASILEGACG